MKSVAELKQEGKVLEIPQLWRWQDSPNAWKKTRLATSKNQEQCELCGRGVRPGSGWLVHAVNGGNEVADVNEEVAQEAGEMGWWLLGPECGKKIPSNFRRRA